MARPKRRTGERRRSDRLSRRLRPVLIGFAIDAIAIAVLLVAQHRTKAGINVLVRRLKGEEAAFPRPRFLGNGNVEDFERLASELEDLRRSATTDPVTGLPNKATLQTDLLLYTEVAARDGALLSVCVADLDHFKDVNDGHGHAAGDAVLSQLGERLGAFVMAGERIGRWGGDEFLLLLPRLDLGEARARAEDARRAVDATAFLLPDGSSLELTVTIGVATGHREALEANRLFRAADADLLETKRGGRNRVGPGRLLS